MGCNVYGIGRNGMVEWQGMNKRERDGFGGGGSKWMVEWEGEVTDEKEDPSQLLSRD